jgi:protein-tyrosine-phosphatase
MDVFVLSSLHEGAPMALLEAMALGTPVVATAVGGVPEILTQGTTGLLVGGQDASGLAAACLELVRNPEWARRMAERARRVAADRFSHRRCGAALVGTYHAVTHRPRLAGPGLSPWVAALARGTRRSVAAALGSSARRRVESARRDPGLLREALRSARQILVVCHGNIIRSPFAAHLLAQKLEEGCPLRIVSRGLGARPGTPSPAPAVLAAAGFQVDLTTHLALPVSVGDVAASDVIFVMDVAQLRQMERRHPAARGKTFLLTSLAPDWPLEVRDPFAQHDSVFQASYEHIAAAVGPIARLLPVRGLAE